MRPLTWVRWILSALGLLYFPAAFAGSLWLVPATAAVVVIAWLYWEGWQSCRKELALLLAVLLVYFAPTVIPCGAEANFCIGWMIDQEVYLLTAGALLYVCGYVTADRAGGIAASIFAAGLSLLVAMALVLLITQANLTTEIKPPVLPLFVERNDLAPLVAWMFFVHRLLRTVTGTPLIRVVTYLVVVVVAGLLSLATQSRLVATISVIGAVCFVPFDRHWRWQWATVGVAVACLLAVEYQKVLLLVERALLTDGGPSVSTRFYLWRNGWEMFLAAPWFGHGLGGFPELTTLYGRPLPAGTDLDVRFISWPHNVFVEVLVEKGVAGLVAFSCLLALAIRNLAHRPPQGLEAARGAAGYLLVALLVVGSLDSTTKRLWYLPSLLYLLGMSERISRARKLSVKVAAGANEASVDKPAVDE